jgi:beta-glucosidase
VKELPVTPTPEQQAAALLAELTTPEKIAFLHQHQPAVERLGLAKFLTGCEALHGVAWIGRATVFPQAVGLGASWDRDLVRRIGQAVSTEVRAFKQDTANALQLSDQSEKPPMVSLNVWAPVVNPLRDPRWGRNEEGYSEDPHATAEIATAYCTGLRGNHPTIWRTTPILKHFLAYNTETDRDTVDIQVPERVLHEYELAAFRGPIEAGVAAGVMPGYNLTNGIPNHVHPLINETLHTWDPDLAICSDAQAPSNLVNREKSFPTHTESHAAALKAGIDSYTDNSTDSQPTIDRFTEALELGLITETDIDTAVRRLLLLRARSGEFTPESDPYTEIHADAIDSTRHRNLAREAALAQIVLLKNESDTLPLTADNPAPRRIAVIGHLGTRVLTDWYSGTLPYSISIADGLATELAPHGTEVIAADGADLVLLRATDGTGEFGPFRHQDWGTSMQCPLPVHTLQSTENGKYLTLTGQDDTEIEARADTPDGWSVKELWEFETATGKHTAEDPAHEPLLLRSNAPHHRKYARIDPTTGHLLADTENPEQATRFQLEPITSGLHEASELAATTDRVILVLGNDPHINGRETIDRNNLTLPPQQEQLLHAVLAANPNTVLVLVSSYPYAIDWAAQHIPAILWTSHAGQELGTAVAQVLNGQHNPSGRLPQTWYSSSADLPAHDDYDIIGSGWTYRYSWREHVFPFGHGLSYATFMYTAPTAIVRDEDSGPFTIVAELTVTNTSDVPGNEIVQLYARRVAGQGLDPEYEPLRSLVGFERITLAPGESRTVTLEVPQARLEQWSVDKAAAFLPTGYYEFEFSHSSADPAATTRLILP